MPGGQVQQPACDIGEVLVDHVHEPEMTQSPGQAATLRQDLAEQQRSGFGYSYSIYQSGTPAT